MNNGVLVFADNSLTEYTFCCKRSSVEIHLIFYKLIDVLFRVFEL